MTFLTLTHHERTFGNLDESKERLVGKMKGIGPKPRVPDLRKNVPRLYPLAAAQGSCLEESANPTRVSSVLACKVPAPGSLATNDFAGRDGLAPRLVENR